MGYVPPPLPLEVRVAKVRGSLRVSRASEGDIHRILRGYLGVYCSYGLARAERGLGGVCSRLPLRFSSLCLRHWLQFSVRNFFSSLNRELSFAFSRHPRVPTEEVLHTPADWEAEPPCQLWLDPLDQ